MYNLLHVSKTNLIKDEAELRKIIPPYPRVMDKRIVPTLDHYCMEIICSARLVILATSDKNLPMRVVDASNVCVVDNTSIKVSIKISTRGSSICNGSLYFLIPGVGHGLRVNGQVTMDAQVLEFQVSAAYVHCARAAARSVLWGSNFSKDDSRLDAPPSLNSRDWHIQCSPYLMLKTMNIANQTELSPRGDEPGFVKQIGPETLFIPERPGNKVAVSLRNIIENPKVELLFFIPGQNSVLNIQGNATLSTNEALLKMCVVKGKTPKIGILLSINHCSIEESEELAKSESWFSESLVDEKKLTRFSKVLSTHMNGEGLLGKATTPVVQAIVNHDLKNLY